MPPLQPPLPLFSFNLSFSSFVKDGKDTSSFSWVLSSFFLSFGLFSFLCFLYVSNNSQFLFFTSSPSLPIHPSMTVFKVHLLPSLPYASFFTDSRAVSSSATQGPVLVCVTKDTASMHCYFNLGRILVEDCLGFSLFFFKCCKKHKLLCVCARTCIQKGIIAMVLDLIFCLFVFLYNNLS